MNLDEELFLSAYLDGALAAEPSRRVDLALETDPKLADDLRTLSAVRDLVAGLPRPAPPAGFDVSAGVLSRIERRSAFGRVALIFARPSVQVLAAAASLLLTATLAVAVLWAARGGQAGPGLVAENRPAPEPAGPRLDRPGPEPAAAPLAVAVAETASEAAVPGPDAADRRRDAEQQKLRHLLDSPNLRKVFVLTDVVSDAPARRVNDLLGKSPRRLASYVCITVARGVGPDAGAAGPAEVFVAVMDDLEVDDFRKDLTTAFHDSFREADPKPEQVTQLAEIGQIAVYPGQPVAGVTVPDARLALRSLAPPEALLVLGEIELAVSAGPTPEQELSSPIHSLDPRPGDRSPKPDLAKSDRPQTAKRPVSVVLVWVPKPERGRDSP